MHVPKHSIYEYEYNNNENRSHEFLRQQGRISRVRRGEMEGRNVHTIIYSQKVREKTLSKTHFFQWN